MKALDYKLLEEIRIAIYPMGRIETMLRQLVPANLTHVVRMKIIELSAFYTVNKPNQRVFTNRLVNSS